MGMIIANLWVGFKILDMNKKRLSQAQQIKQLEKNVAQLQEMCVYLHQMITKEEDGDDKTSW